MPTVTEPSRILRRTLIALGVVAGIVAIVAGSAWLAAAEGLLAAPVTRAIAGYLGRDLVVEGGLSIRLGRVTRVTADGIRLANPPWGARPDMLVLRHLVVEIETRPLLEDRVVLRSIVAEGLDLALERRADGSQNWDFDLPERTEQEPDGALIVRHAAIPGAHLRFTGPRLERPLDAVLDLGMAETGTGGLGLAVKGEVNATPLDLRAGVVPAAALGTFRDFRFDIAGTLDQVTLEARGHVDSLAHPVDTAMRLDLEAPDAAYLYSRLGIRNLGDGPVALGAEISPAPGGGGVRGWGGGRLGGFEIAARAAVAMDGAIRGLQARVAGPDLSLLGGLAGIDRLPASAFRLSFDASEDAGRLRIAGSELELELGRLRLTGTVPGAPALAGSAFDVSASGPDLARVEALAGLPRIAPGAFDAAGTVEVEAENAVRIDLRGRTTAGTLEARGRLGGPRLEGTRLALAAAGPDLGAVLRPLGLARASGGAFRASGDVAYGAAGLTLRDARLDVAGDELRVTGSLGRSPRDQARLGVELAGPDAARLGARLGIAGLPAGTYRVKGDVRRAPGRTQLTNLRALVGGATVQVDGVLGDPPRLVGTDLRVGASGPALERFAGLAPTWPLPAGAFRAAAGIARKAGTLSIDGLDLSAGGAKASGSLVLPWPVDRSSLQFDLQAAGADVSAFFDGDARRELAASRFELAARGSMSGGRWSFDRLHAKSEHGSVDLKGDLALAPRFQTRSLVVDADIDSLRRASAVIGRDWIDQPLRLHAQFAGNGSDFTLEELTGAIGPSDFSGTAVVRRSGKLPHAELTLASRHIDLRPFLGADAGPRPPETSKRRGDKRLLIPATPLSLPWLGGATGTLALRAKEAFLSDQPLRDLKVDATLSDGRLLAAPIEIGTLGGRLTGAVELRQDGEAVAIAVRATGSDLAIGVIPFASSGGDASRFEANIDLSGRGASLRELASSLDGTVRLVGRGGSIANSRVLSVSGDFFRELVTTLNPLTTKQPKTAVVCVAYLLSAKDGVVATDPAIVMRTAEMDMVSRGGVDLNTEKLDFSFRTAARKGLGLSAAQLVNPYIKVSGTLASPGLALDPKGALVTGGAAFATGGLSILATAAWDRVVQSKDPCAAALAESKGK